MNAKFGNYKKITDVGKSLKKILIDNNPVQKKAMNLAQQTKEKA
jgi:hypothetical protein